MKFNRYANNKYNNKRSKCSLGHSHRSKLECGYCLNLQALKANGDIKDFQYEFRYALVVNGKTIGHHKPDFTVTTKNGLTEVHETKGMGTADWQLRKKLFEAIYPEIPYIVIK